MPAPATAEEFLDLIRKSGVVEEARLSTYVKQLQSSSNVPTDMSKYAGLFVHDGLLTFFQAEQFLLGKWKRFTIGKYKVLERLGSGGMGQVFLCEHKLMRRKVAVKVLPTAKAEDSSSLERFYREARAVAALDHPNIVRAYDIDQDDNLHFLVMEYVDGVSLQDLIKKHGPLDVTRACHYIYWSAIGLEHAHEGGLIHRDIKPGNILIDRQGTVKILDMGLARFFNDDEDNLTKKFDENVLGTADYLAPEQALDSHSVDGRADIYSLGATFYFMLAGHQPFVDGTVAQKLIWHQTRNPKPLRDLRKDVPQGVVAIVEKMMAKDPNQRYATPGELAEALSPWVQTPIDAPPEKEMPVLSAAALSIGSGGMTTSVRQVPQAPRSAGGSGASQGPGGSGSMPTSKPASGGSGRGSKKTFPTRPTPSPTPVSDSEQTKRRSASVPIVETLSSDQQWESLAADTNDASHENTDRQPNPAKPKKTAKPTVEPIEEPEKKAPPRKKKKSQMMPIAIAALVLLAAGACFSVYWFVIRTPSKLDGNQGATTEGAKLTVSKAGGAGQFNSVKEALEKAKEGQRIVILDSPWDEELTTSSGQGKGVVIEGENKDVVWRIPPGRASKKIVLLQSPAGLTIRNLKFEGNGQTSTGLMITGKADDLLIEDVTIKDMNDAGIQFSDCLGSEGHPAVIQRVRIVGGKTPDSDAGIIFAGSTEKKAKDTIYYRNESIIVRDCRLEGRFRGGAVTIDGSLTKVEIRNNRIWQANDGVLFRNAKAGQAFRLKLVNNTFHSIANAGIHFPNAGVLTQPPNVNDQNLELEFNYFYGVNLVFRSDDNYNGPGLFKTPPADNARNPSSKDGNPNIGAKQIDATLFTSTDDDRTFLHYDRRSPLANAAGGKPIGVPPVN